MILRIISKQTNLFIRDDFEYNEEIEIALNVEPAQGLYKPKWNGQEWVEGLTQEEIEEIKASVVVEPTLEERLQMAEDTILFMLMGGI